MREALLRFAEAMEEVLSDNDSKGGWSPQQCTMEYLRHRAVEEAFEYYQTLSSKELLDIANFLMMIWNRQTGTKLYM